MDPDALKSIYSRIHLCHVCPHMDKEKGLRRIDAVDSGMDTFVVSQALAETTLRKTGVNFFGLNGTPGNTGRQLERFLALFSRTIFPAREIILENGIRIPARSAQLKTVYNTEVAQCFPGKKTNGNGDREPSDTEVLSCKQERFLEIELTLIKPRLVILMGRQARNNFYDHYINERHPEKLGDHIEAIVMERKLPQAKLGDHNFFVCPIQHASSANPRFAAMLKNTVLVALIAEVLGSGNAPWQSR
jgi:hypothetical protein